MFSVTRNPHNPLIQSDNQHSWRGLATFNASPAVCNDQLHLVYRAMGDRAYYHGQDVELSVIGHVVIDPTQPDTSQSEHSVLIDPIEDWEEFGVEDPRITKIDDTYYIFYTALGGFPFSAANIRSAVATTKDFKTIDSRRLITPFNAKAMTLFPEKVNGKWTLMLTVNSDQPPSYLAFAQFDELDDMYDQDFWLHWYANLEQHTIDLRRKDSDHCEIGAAPILTDDGWLLIYSHIQHYFTDNKLFGVEAVLLDRDDPSKIIAQTDYPFLVPEESYEQYGQLGNIIFPSGATVNDDELTVYYGASDTTVCSASLSLSALLESMQMATKSYVTRLSKNPILKPTANTWENRYVFNPTALLVDGEIHVLYRAMGDDNTSVIGRAISKDGLNFTSRDKQPIYVPRADFEIKKKLKGLSGCEDARAIIIGDSVHLTYTGYNGVDLPAVAHSSIKLSDYKANNWQAWSEPVLISPKQIDDKDAAIIPDKINGQYMVLHRIDHHICADFVPDLNFKEHTLVRCIQIMGPRRGMWDSQKIGINGPPLKTERGWLQFYHGINDNDQYLMGAALLDLTDPTIVIGRTTMPLMTPELSWEITGWIDNVVFSCGQIVKDDTIYIYYGGADTVVGVATIGLSQLVDELSK